MTVVDNGSDNASGNGSDLAAALRAVVGHDAVVSDPDVWAEYAVDWTGRWSGIPAAVVLPSDVAQTVAVIGVCRRFNVPWVPQGGNTGLVGGSVPVGGEVVVSTCRMRTIGEVDCDSMQVSVGAGVTLTELAAAVAPHGLLYGIDFGARDRATIGGTIATNAGGNAVLHYGMTRAQLVGIEAVLPDGSVIHRMQGLVKDNTGLNLAQLMCGSEGTLGVITSARLQLRPALSPRVTVALGVASVSDALDVLRHLRGVSAMVGCELMRGHDISALCERRAWPIPAPWAAPWAMLVEAVGPGAFDELASAVERSAGAIVGEPAVAVGTAARDDWWRVRDAQGEIASLFGPAVKLDVSIPLLRLTEFVDGLDDAIGAAAPVGRTVVFGHLGDGNLHVNIAASVERFEAIEACVLERVLDCGGVVSAEHGIGRLKRGWLIRDRGGPDVEVMRSIKRAIDPEGLANPGVLYPASHDHAVT